MAQLAVFKKLFAVIAHQHDDRVWIVAQDAFDDRFRPGSDGLPAAAGRLKNSARPRSNTHYHIDTYNEEASHDGTNF